MSINFDKISGRFAHAIVFGVVAGLCNLMLVSAAFAGGGNNGNIFGNQVGGIKVDASGVVSMAPVEFKAELRDLMKKTVKPAEADLARAVEMRMVSLKGLNAAIKDAVENHMGKIPEEVKYMAGLQRIEFVFVYPEKGDIVLAGPGEGWKVDDSGNVVGETTGRAVLRIEDFVVAMKSADNARKGLGISASIDPTEEGRRNLTNVTKKIKRFSPQAVRAMEQALGMQDISLTGIDSNTHFARVLVAADYRMKRIAMGLDRSPLKSIPSFLQIMKQKKGKTNNMMPRWWLATNYKPLGKSADGNAWQLRGDGVKCMTENDLITEEGKAKRTGKSGHIAQLWADAMTKNYDELSRVEPVFGELRNIMDMCVVAALIKKENMLTKLDLDIDSIVGDNSKSVLRTYAVPKTVPTKASYMTLSRGNVLVTCSGGVQVESWEMLAKTEVIKSIAQPYGKAKPFGSVTWWWN